MTAHDGLAVLAARVAREAGRLLAEHAAAPASGVETKSSPTDMVSAADRAAEALIVARLQAERPDDGLLGEEGTATAGSSGLVWIVDPLDGTTNFLYRHPLWSVSIAVADDAGPVAGCVYHPALDETFTAVRGQGASLDGRPIHVSEPAELAVALIGTGFAYAAERRRLQADQLRAVIGAVRDVRRGGSAALDLAWTACGRLDGYYETGLNPWDWAAGSLLVREAGGRVEVGPGPLGADQCVAAGASLYDRLATLVS